MRNYTIVMAALAALALCACTAPGIEPGPTPPTPPAPIGTPDPTVTARSLATTVSWDAVEGAASYNLYARAVSLSPSLSKADGDFSLLASIDDTGAASFSYDHTGLSNCMNYEYFVTAVDEEGAEGEDSTTVIGEPATEGVFDETFGTAGITVDTGEIGTFTDVALFSDGGIAATQDLTGLHAALHVYTADGTFVRSVDLDADPTIDITNVTSLAIDADDNVYVAGDDDDMRVCKFDRDGNLDASFGQIGNPGCYRYGINDTDGNDIIVDNEGGVIVVGEDSNVVNDALIVWRFTPDGTLDWTSSYTVVDDEYRGETVAVVGDLIIAVGVQNDLAAERLLVTSFELDGTFVNVIVDTGLGGTTIGYDVSETAAGEVLVTGVSMDLAPTPKPHMYLALFTPALTFIDDAGYDYSTGVGSAALGYASTNDCRGRALVAGADVLGVGNTAVIRTDAALDLDASFGNNAPSDGWFLFSRGLGDGAFGITEDARGRIVLGGLSADGGGNNRPVILRLK